jgi:hypothetical protein
LFWREGALQGEKSFGVERMEREFYTSTARKLEASKGVRRLEGRESFEEAKPMNA